MQPKMPKTPFSMNLSRSAKETELRIRNIFQWKKKRPPVIALVAAVLVIVFCGALIGFDNNPRNGTLGEIYQEYFAENPISYISYENKEDWGYPSLTPESKNFGVAAEYVQSMELRSVLGHKQYIGDFDRRNGAVVLRSANGQELWIDLYPTGYVVVSGEGAGRLDKGDDARVYQVSGAFDVEVFLSYLASELSEEENADITQDNVLALEGLSEIGKTLASIWSENPGFEYRTVQIPGAAGLCLKQIQDGPLCYFVGTHDGPSLQEVGGEYADQLRCAGIVSTVGRAFPATADGVSLEQFFAELVVSEYTYYTQDGSGQGWIEFSYGGYCVWIDTNGEGAYSDHYVESSVMRHDYPLVVVDKEIEIANSAISSEYARAAAVVDVNQHRGRLATMDGISHMPLDELPQEVLDSLTLVSETDLSGRYNPEWGWHRVYTAPGLEITTTAPSATYLEWMEEVDKNNRALFPTEADFYAYIEGEEGREWLVSVTITNDSYATQAGLRVGMTCAQAETLGYYLTEGQNTVGVGEPMITIYVENDAVVKIYKSFQLGRYIGKFFEL